MLTAADNFSLRTGYRLQWEARQNAWVLLFPEGMVKLNESAQLILKCCAEPTNQQTVIAHVQAQFPDQEVAEDIREFLQDAYQQQWLELCQN